METFDRIAGWGEVVLVPTSLGLLLVACGLGGVRIWRWRLLWALPVVWVAAGGLGAVFVSLLFLGAVTLVARLARGRSGVWKLAVPLVALTAVTVAQPFGVQAHRLGDVEAQGAAAAASDPEALDPVDTHSLDVAGVPLMRFASYRRKIESDVFAGLGECCPPTHSLRVRSWLWPGLMTHATQVMEICGDSPCWEPGSSALKLRRMSGQWYLTLADSSKPAQAWRLGLGIVSAWGGAYWLLAGAGMVVLLRRRRQRSTESSEIAAPATS